MTYAPDQNRMTPTGKALTNTYKAFAFVAEGLSQIYGQ
ncbi:hypothetical protein SUS17_2388 [Sphingomonas sp. S17]|nr:hypothetical protein SUS17_2388 [Sphingomonas sp. S17]